MVIILKKIGLVAVISFILDRIIKIIVDKSLVPFIKYKLIGNILYLLKCNNTGAAFSLMSGSTMFLIIITIIALYFIYTYIKKENNENKVMNVFYGLLIGGIIGNLFDRISYGYVIDYIGVNIFKYSFPIFNLADILIVISALYILINEFRGNKNENSNS